MPKCQHCEKEFAKQGQLNLHVYHCGLKKAAGVSTKKRQNRAAGSTGSGQCEHEMRLLNPRVQIELQAIRHGYKEVCSLCKDLA
jgi:hypothetical protein